MLPRQIEQILLVRKSSCPRMLQVLQRYVSSVPIFDLVMDLKEMMNEQMISIGSCFCGKQISSALLYKFKSLRGDPSLYNNKNLKF